MFNKIARGRMRLVENVTYELFDKDGNRKQLFQENALGRFLSKRGIAYPQIALFGGLSFSKQISNLITNAGAADVASRINGSGGAAAFAYIGVGTGATAAAVTDTALQTEKKTDGTAASGVHAGSAPTLSLVTTDVTNDTAQLLSTLAFTATLAITESGVFNAATNGTMLARQVFSAINVVSGDSLQITWKFDID